jgi:hypothetical protein
LKRSCFLAPVLFRFLGVLPIHRYAVGVKQCDNYPT